MTTLLSCPPSSHPSVVQFPRPPKIGGVKFILPQSHVGSPYIICTIPPYNVLGSPYNISLQCLGLALQYLPTKSLALPTLPLASSPPTHPPNIQGSSLNIKALSPISKALSPIPKALPHNIPGFLSPYCVERA